MKNSRIVYWPALLIMAASLCLILYSVFGVTEHRFPRLAGDGRHFGGPGDERGSGELFKKFGTFAIFAAAASYAWYQLKKKRKSSSGLVRLLVRWFDKLHQPLGYAAAALVAAHAVYFLTQAAVKRETYSGIAAFALLLGLGVYGFLIRRVRNKHLRKIHFLLASAFAIAAVIHAGGQAIVAAVGVALFWGALILVERTNRTRT